jgi:hypothetical protein
VDAALQREPSVTASAVRPFHGGNYNHRVLGQNDKYPTILATSLTQKWQRAVEYCLRAAMKAGELPKTFKATEVANFIISGLQGAVLLAKAERDSPPLKTSRKSCFRRF